MDSCGDGFLLGLRGGDFADEGDFLFAVGLTVVAEDFVEPEFGFGLDVRLLPGIPGVPGLGFAGDQAPIDGGDLVLLGDRQDALEGAALGAGHVFRAENRAMISLQLADVLQEI